MEQSYQQRFYDYQTTARGRLTAQSLQREFEKSRKWYRKRIGHYLPEDRGASILDCPCGYGNILYFLKSEGYRQVTGIDFDPKQIALARSLNLNAEVAEALDYLRDRAEAFEVIFSVDFLEHIERNTAIEFLELVHRALKPGGVLIIRTPCCDGPFGAAHRYNDITHQWAMTVVCAKDLFRMSGFDQVAVIDEHPQVIERNFHHYRRVVAFHIARIIAERFYRALTTTVPKVWSRSMWVIGTKAGD